MMDERSFRRNLSDSGEAGELWPKRTAIKLETGITFGLQMKINPTHGLPFQLQVFFVILLLAMGWSCKPAMKKESNIETWLEKNFPQQFVVERSLRDIHPKNFYLNKHTSIISSKADPLVQFEIVWYKEKTDLGLTVEEVKTLADNSTRDIGLARTWHEKLKANGLEKFSVGVIDMALYVLPYGEPDPATRLKIVERVFKTLQAEQDTAQTSIWMECMEDTAYGKEIKEIIPFGYWRRKDTWHDDHKIMSLDFEYSSGQDVKELNQHWQFNAASKRSLVYANEAYAKAETWAKTHLDPPYYLEANQLVQFSTDDNDPLAVHYSFPFYPANPGDDAQKADETRLGYVTGIYQTDKRTFSQIKKVKNL